MKCSLFVVAGLLVTAAAGGVAAEEPLPIHGFLQAASAYRLLRPDACPRTQRLACEEEFVLGEGRARLEVEPRGERWGLTVKAELIWDAVAGEVDGDLREGYLDLRFPALDLRAGRQIVTWGVGDLVFINDVFPKDWVAFVSGLPLEYLKKGSDAVSATGHWRGTSVQLVLTPRFEADTLPEAGGRLRFHDPMAAIEARRTDDPSPSLDHLESGLRVFRNLAGWDLSLYAYRGFFRAPAAEVEAGPRLRFFFPPLDVWGASAQGAALGGVVSVEAGYHDSRADRSGRNPAVENSSFRFLAGYQREIVPDLTASGQYYVQAMEDHAAYRRTRGPGMARRPALRHVLTLRLTRLLWHQTLRLGVFALASPNEGDWYVGPEARYQITDAWSATVGVNAFGGPRRSEFGQFEGNANLYAAVRYAF
ncbi:MAG: hypothetical protein A3E31_13375 [Candidatus Rokubacteria bacterium RIFCSPHIGHO2_12_FULL_73_22]|nr:MAG: hypothetical protein A3D33_16715 [Candidatus Rokubacteria bacterium RIFCSPHIGHO2_02_FULL_73_26]OGL03296.1 MAG: hypothetical protein A3E31_13375 [Candidatus Rokubacteria bacterium RIFCSPHIGHO2_12_FULL_73_22]OGL12765.1 MAG: hypothetical protein A3I14_17215 [Candidatus Rokubacteria bacterium RIFCSPLOWO2_02_FULL_73_56]OGL27514.1 MAG: hypothetical protein A3G44_05550 [Candidatus Rokubacteria bacterium RIFCSPLOWO2_12_FULL_73_47]